MKVLITGGCGFLGSNIAAKLLKMGEEIIIVDDLSRLGSEKNFEWLKSLISSNNFHFYKAEVNDKETIEEVFKMHTSIDYVCHLAGQVAMTKSIDDPLRDFKTNVVGTFNILEAIRNIQPDCFIAYSSTNKVYGDLNHIKKNENNKRYSLPDFPDGLDENLPLDFSTPYGCSKGAADQYIKDYSRVYGLNTIVFRHSSIYGGRQFSSFDQGWVGWFIKQAINQKNAIRKGLHIEPFEISGSGKQVRDLLHADDLVELYLKAYENRESLKGEVFNIGGGIKNSMSLLELFTFLENFLELDLLKFIHLERRKSDQDFFVANINKIRNTIGWQPKLDKEEGLEKMIKWSYQIN